MKITCKRDGWIFLTALALAFASSVNAAVITYVGRLTDAGTGWRSNQVTKPLDLDADHVFGTDGYQLVSRSPVPPNYVVSMGSRSTLTSSSATYATLQDPVNPAGSFVTGIMSTRAVVGARTPLFAFFLNERAVGRTIRVGLLIDNLDNANNNSDGFSLLQVAGGTAASPEVPTVSSELNNGKPDWLFFDISEASGDESFIVQGKAGSNGSAALAGVTFDSAVVPWSMTEPTIPELSGLDDAMTRYMGRRGISRGGLAVTKDGHLVMNRAYTHAREGVFPTQTTNRFRIASLTKQLTAVGVLQLAQAGRLNLTNTIGRLLHLTNFVDGRFTNVTVQQLLQHTGGWNRDRSYEPMFIDARISSALGRPLPITIPTIIDYMQRQPLDFEPGTEFHYSNFGYCLLGRIIEVVSGQSYEEFIQANVLRPIGIENMRLGRSLLTNAWPGEVNYEDTVFGLVDSAMGPGGPAKVPMPYGGFNLENMDAHGGWIATAADLVRFSSAFDVATNSPLLRPEWIQVMWSPPSFQSNADAYYGAGWWVRPVGNGTYNAWHDGALPGTVTYTVRRADGVCWATVFNLRYDDVRFLPPFGDAAIDNEINSAINAVTSWPSVTSAATSITSTEAVLNGRIHPGGSLTDTWFEWGTTAAYGNYTVTNQVNADVTLAVSNQLGGLNPGVTYHFRVVAQRESGTTSYGSDQTFTTPRFFTAPVAGLPELKRAAVGWADYDNDGRLDVFLMGERTGGAVGQLWRNTSTGLSNVTASAFPVGVALGARDGSLAWGDCDNDGRLDLLLTGLGVSAGVCELWRNTPLGFSNVTANVFPPGPNAPPGVTGGSVAWADYDRDGRLDFILTGKSAGGAICQLWRNVGSGFANVSGNAFLSGPPPAVSESAVAWADYDRDGYLDLLVTGEGTNGKTSQLWRNVGNGFRLVPVPGLPGVSSGAVAWGDYDHDGRLDFLLTGAGNGGGSVFQLWRNGEDTFSNVTVAAFPDGPPPGVSDSAVAWGDYDNDGALDFLLAGLANGNKVGQLWHNTDDGFRNAPDLSMPTLPPISDGAVAWADYDNDGGLDFLCVGDGFCELRHNLATVFNRPPSVPTGLHGLFTERGLLLRWDAATDAETPVDGLSYNVRAGTVPGGIDLLSGQVNVADGFRRLPALGNAQTTLSLLLSNVAVGQNVYWSVQAVDSALAGGAFATEAVFPFSITTQPATSIGPTFASLSGTIGLRSFPTAVWWEWGTTTAYGNSTAESQLAAGYSSLTPVRRLTGLVAGQTYHFRFAARSIWNIASFTNYGGDLTFTTPRFTNVAVAFGGFTNHAYWRMGEDDAGVTTNLASVTNTINHVEGGPDLSFSPGAQYSSSVSTSATARVGSARSIYASLGVTPWVSALTNNFGLELWVKPFASSTGPKCLAYNGSTTGNGWGLYQSNSSYVAWFGGVGTFGSAPAVASTWTHLALVRDNGTNTLFVNGQPAGTTTFAPRLPVGSFAVATAPNLVGTDVFNGNLDEVRVFSFPPGGFTTNALLLINGRSPVITTLEATDLGLTDAVLNSSVDPENADTSSWFEWGLNSDYGFFTPTVPVAGLSSLDLSHALTGLVPGITYHYRVAASNLFGISYGQDESFTLPIFAEVTATAFSSSVPPSLTLSSATWGDFDHDGRMDLAMIGKGDAGPTSQLWRNNGNGFSNVTATAFPEGLPGVYQGAVAWGDPNNDGRLDLVLTGNTGSGRVSQLWQNTGGGFSNVTAARFPAGLPGVDASAVAWGDYDHDGLVDLLVTGNNGAGGVAQLWRNTGDQFTDVTSAVFPGGLPGVSLSAAAWGDYDSDGRLDLVLTGWRNNDSTAQLWRNTGSGFVDVTGAAFASGLSGVSDGSAAWGDYNNDGRMDLLLLGKTPGGSVVQLWHNTGTGFSNVTAAIFTTGLRGLRASAVAWGDYDNDGYSDLLISGTADDPTTRVAQLWRNKSGAGGGFVDVTATAFLSGPLAGVTDGSVNWADYDGDGRLDFWVTGNGSGSANVSQLWRNHTEVVNAPPRAPTGLTATLSATGAMLSWNAATESFVPDGGLSYNVRAGTTPGGSDLLAAQVDAVSGFRRLPGLGNAGQSRRLFLGGVTTGQTIYWSVQAVDTAFAGGPFAAERSIRYGIVTTTADHGVGSLRDAVSHSAPAKWITFDPSLSGQTIVLTNGPITFSNAVTVDASSLPGGIAVSGGRRSKVMIVSAGSSVTMDSLAIVDGLNNIGIPLGGGIDSSGNLTLHRCTLSGNVAVNGSSGAGGGLYVRAGAATLNACTLFGNAAGASGGGIANPSGVLTLNQCTLTANLAGNGGGVGFGGQNGALSLNQSTIFGNTATNLGGGISRAGNNTFAVFNSIVAGNTQGTGSDLASNGGPVTTLGANMINGPSPLLASLGFYGGRTPTLPPQPGSLALDTGAATSFSTDQRGSVRVQGSAPDLGAVEGAFDPAIPFRAITMPGDGSLRFSFVNLSGPNYTVLTSTNVAAPFSEWLNLGPAVEGPAGTFQFTDLDAVNHSQRFYRVITP